MGDVRHSYWMYSIATDAINDRDRLRQHLEQVGIETRPVFYPVHTMPMYSKKYQRHPVAENIGWRGINLPSWPGLIHEQVVYVCNEILKFYNQKL